jgi:hypothetical protein
MITTIRKEIYFDPRLRRITQLELEITQALIRGHKATMDDKFMHHRDELKKLRKELYIGIIK